MANKKYTKVYKYKNRSEKEKLDIPEGQKIAWKEQPKPSSAPRHSKNWQPSKRK